MNFKKIISTVFHPVFIPSLALLLLYNLCPNLFEYVDKPNFYGWLAQITLNTILFPVLTVVLLWKLEFAKSIHLHTQKERYAPYIASILFCFWVFYVFYKTQNAPSIIIGFLLGNFICICLLFLINIFYKISMHAMAMGSLLGLNLAAGFICGCTNYNLYGILIALVISALVLPARISDTEHTKPQVVLGFVLGIITQTISILVFK